MSNSLSTLLPDSHVQSHRPGLVLVVGASGVGKDSLLAGARAALAGREDIVFPRRVITRAPGLGGEDYLTVSEAEFSNMQRQNRFALHWSAHGLHYGIPRDIEADLQRGRNVVANVSRAVLDEARRRYPGLRIIHVTASPSVIAQRLRQRGRETEAEIVARLQRAIAADLSGDDVAICNNDGPLSDGIAHFLRLLA
jgi:ribose 1,5-bisphosphokinase